MPQNLHSVTRAALDPVSSSRLVDDPSCACGSMSLVQPCSSQATLMLLSVNCCSHLAKILCHVPQRASAPILANTTIVVMSGSVNSNFVRAWRVTSRPAVLTATTRGGVAALHVGMGKGQAKQSSARMGCGSGRMGFGARIRSGRRATRAACSLLRSASITPPRPVGSGLRLVPHLQARGSAGHGASHHAAARAPGHRCVATRQVSLHARAARRRGTGSL